MMQDVILIPHIVIQNANALSSPFTIGFPAITAWMGAVHSLERKLNNRLALNNSSSVSFIGMGIVSHRFSLHTYRGPGDYVNSIVGTSNPLLKDGSRPPFIEEARCHIEASIIIEFSGISKLEQNEVLKNLEEIIFHMKIAGGDVLGFESLKVVSDLGVLKRSLMPGYLLVERRDLMIQGMEEGLDALDTIIEFNSVHHNCSPTDDDSENEYIWESKRRELEDGVTGWVVPIATGYQGLTSPGIALNQRDSHTPHVFAEAIITLGEFAMPYKKRFNSLDTMIWKYKFDGEQELYLCQQELLDLF
jgi:CRISPR-associated protein Csy2